MPRHTRSRRLGDRGQARVGGQEDRGHQQEDAIVSGSRPPAVFAPKSRRPCLQVRHPIQCTYSKFNVEVTLEKDKYNKKGDIVRIVPNRTRATFYTPYMTFHIRTYVRVYT